MPQTRGEDKYDLQLINTKGEKKVKSQPWYKERLHTRHIKEVGRTQPHLVGSKWTFLKDGLDDFRAGVPCEPKGGALIKPDRADLPIRSAHRRPKQQILPPLTRHQVLYSRELPGQERRRQNIERIMNGLKEHPLTLYSHIENSVPPELFEDLIDVLDPEMRLGEVDDEDYEEAHYGDDSLSRTTPEEQVYPEEDEVHPATPEGGEVVGNDDADAQADAEEDKKEEDQEEAKDTVEPLLQPFKNASLEEQVESTEKRSELANNAYAWPSMNKAKQFWEDMDPELYKGGFKWLPSQKDPTVAAAALTAEEDAHIKKVAKDFCSWVAELGGESNNIDESTVAGLFSGGYESKPALSAPIHVVELTNVPPELRVHSAAANNQSRESRTSSAGSANDRLLRPGYVMNKPPKRVNYGAWYLKPKQWKTLKPGEKLDDPRKTQDNFSDAKKKSTLLDGELVHMHGAREFIRFMREKGQNVPEFLSRVAVLQSEDDARQAAEAAARAEQLKNVTMNTTRAKTTTAAGTHGGLATPQGMTTEAT